MVVWGREGVLGESGLPHCIRWEKQRAWIGKRGGSAWLHFQHPPHHSLLIRKENSPHLHHFVPLLLQIWFSSELHRIQSTAANSLVCLLTKCSFIKSLYLQSPAPSPRLSSHPLILVSAYNPHPLQNSSPSSQIGHKGYSSRCGVITNP